MNIKLQNTTNELKAKVQNENDKLDRLLTEKYNNMQKGIQKNHNDISKLNSSLISHRTCKDIYSYLFLIINYMYIAINIANTL